MMPLMIQLNKFEYKNDDSAEYVIRYITRTRKNEDRAHELVSYGSYHGFIYQKPVEEIVSEFEFIQDQYGTEGSLMCHYVILVKPELFAQMGNDVYRLNAYASACCKYIFDLGYQTCFAIHNSCEKNLHIHLAINTTNYMNGNKLRQYYKEIHKNLEKPLSNLAASFIVPDSTPITIYNL